MTLANRSSAVSGFLLLVVILALILLSLPGKLYFSLFLFRFVFVYIIGLKVYSCGNSFFSQYVPYQFLVHVLLHLYTID